MRKLMTTMGLGVALTLGAAGAVAAQSPRPNTNRPDSVQRQRGDRAERGDRGARRRGGPEAMLLKGITLTDAQKTRLETLRREQAPQMKQAREQFGAVMKEAREARQRGDTATARAKMAEVRTQMDRQREQRIASLRSVLTADQQKQLDANVAALKERGPRDGARGQRGMRDGRRHRGDQPRADRNGTGR